MPTKAEENTVNITNSHAMCNSGISQLREVVVGIRAAIRTLETCKDMDAVRGVEGYGSLVYFQTFPLLLRNREFSFKGRNRRPPRDPFNAILSFVYTLFTGEVQSAVSSVGLDPYLGSLHEVSHKRPSLVCDLVEEWRAPADRLVFNLVNKRLVSPDDFLIRREVLEHWKKKAAPKKSCGSVCEAADFSAWRRRPGT